MFPPHGPPGPETHAHPPFALAAASQLAPVGQKPPHVPAASLPHRATHSAEGPGQQVSPPSEERHRQSCSHSPFTQRSAVHALSSLQSTSDEHPGVGVGGVSATHSHAPVASAMHCPGRATSARSGQTSPGGHVGNTTHRPPHITSLHCGVGVAGAVGCTGTQSQLPSAVIVHCPCRSGTSGPLHTLPSGHGNGKLTVQAPPQTGPPHCGVRVGRGVVVGGGERGTHSHPPFASAVHSPRPSTNSPAGQTLPGGHG